jgi:hypothetical protein
MSLGTRQKLVLNLTFRPTYFQVKYSELDSNHVSACHDDNDDKHYYSMGSDNSVRHFN